MQDNDGLSDFLEHHLGTDPRNPDSDGIMFEKNFFVYYSGDGIDDFVESHGGLHVDFDEDGIIDALDTDSNNDGIPDSPEEMEEDNEEAGAEVAGEETQEIYEEQEQHEEL